MDRFLSKAGSFFRNTFNELGSIADNISSEGWLIIIACLLVCGFFWLRGNKIKST